MAQIPFTRGVPSPDLLPVDDLRAAADAALTKEPALALSYLTGAGHPGLREWIGARHGVPADRVVASNGSLQAFLFLAELFVERSSTKRVLVEAPTYDRPLILLRRAGAEPVGIPVDEHGLDVDALEDDLRRAGAPAFLYVIPTFQNPSGSTLPLERRQKLDRALAPLLVHDRRGRPVRPAALPRREPADDPLARPRPRRDDVVVHEDGRPGPAHRLRDRAGRARRAADALRDRHVHRPGRARAVDARRSTALPGASSPTSRAPRRPSASGRARWRRRSRRTSPPATRWSSPTAATSSGSTSARTARTRRRCSRRRPRPACRT